MEPRERLRGRLLLPTSSFVASSPAWIWPISDAVSDAVSDAHVDNNNGATNNNGTSHHHSNNDREARSAAERLRAHCEAILLQALPAESVQPVRCQALPKHLELSEAASIQRHNGMLGTRAMAKVPVQFSLSRDQLRLLCCPPTTTAPTNTTATTTTTTTATTVAAERESAVVPEGGAATAAARAAKRNAPPNRFLQFRQQVSRENPTMTCSQVSKLAAQRWKGMTNEERQRVAAPSAAGISSSSPNRNDRCDNSRTMVTPPLFPYFFLERPSVCAGVSEVPASSSHAPSSSASEEGESTADEPANRERACPAWDDRNNTKRQRVGKATRSRRSGSGVRETATLHLGLDSDTADSAMQQQPCASWHSCLVADLGGLVPEMTWTNHFFAYGGELISPSSSSSPPPPPPPPPSSSSSSST